VVSRSGEFAVINRSALLLKYKSPAIRWINDADPYDDDPGTTVDSVNSDRTVYLITEEDADTPESRDRWIKRNYKALFEEELEGWYTDPDLWPKKRTLKLFREWFEVECHTVLIDTVGGAIYEDDI
jgi:hypothetical protein